MNEIINQVDLDHDGKVSFDEFVVMLDLKQTQEKVWFIFGLIKFSWFPLLQDVIDRKIDFIWTLKYKEN